MWGARNDKQTLLPAYPFNTNSVTLTRSLSFYVVQNKVHVIIKEYFKNES